MPTPLVARLFLLCLATNGCSTVIVDDDTDSVDPPTNPPEEPPEDPPPPDPPPSPAVFCTGTAFLGGEDDAVLVANFEDQVEIMLRDGSRHALEMPSAPADPPATQWSSIAWSKSQIVVTLMRQSWDDDQTLLQHNTVRWFTRSGVLVDEITSDAQLYAAFVSDAETTIIYRGVVGNGADVLRRSPDGQEIAVTDFDVTSTLIDGKFLAGLDHVSGLYAFLDVDTGELETLPELGTGSPFTEVDALSTWTATGDTATITRRTPGAMQQATVELANASQVSIAETSDDGALLLRYGDASVETWYVRYSTGELTSIPLAGPNGEPAVESNCGWGTFSVMGPDDLVLGVFRSGGDARVGATHPGTGEKSWVGPGFAAPGNFDFHEQGGALAIYAGDGSDTFCPITDWPHPASPDALPAPAMVLSRNDTTLVFDPAQLWDVSFASDGTCAVVQTTDGFSIADLVTGAVTEVSGPLVATLMD